MDITYYIRNDNNTYAEPCSCASIKLSKNNKIYYGGAQWGFHTPSNIVDFINVNCDEVSFNQWVNSLGFSIIIEELI